MWKPVKGIIMTKWAEEIDIDNVLPEYPRPQMVRGEWLNLNGLWDYAIRKMGKAEFSKYDGKILVPFPLESALSGVKKPLKPEETLWYRRTFTIPSDWQGQRILLHFGAVDWKTNVWVNGHHVGEHTGGYYPITFEIVYKAIIENDDRFGTFMVDNITAAHEFNIVYLKNTNAGKLVDIFFGANR